MTRVAQVNLAYNVRTLWFDPNGVEFEVGDKIVVETARGTELGVCSGGNLEVTDEDIANLKSPLKPVLRKATQEDLDTAAEMDKLSQEAMPVFKELAEEFAEDMHPVSVEYLLGGDKAVFYFESEDRVDFRDLVRELAQRLHVRIDMRQIGVRDEARIVGGLAHCGQVVCCKRLGGEFNPVSIKMAKVQDLSLNPQKISGLCGRLMCCLRYEDEAYKDFKSRAPQVGTEIKTPDGMAEVIELDVPLETVKMRIGEDKPVVVPLADFEPSKDGKRPFVVGAEAWEAAKEEDIFALNVMASFHTAQFTGTDTLGSAKAVHHGSLRGKGSYAEASSPEGAGAGEDTSAHRRDRNSVDNGDSTRGRKNNKRGFRRKNDSGESGGRTGRDARLDRGAKAEQFSSKTDATRKPRKRKSVTISSASSGQNTESAVVRPGHKSSGLSQMENNSKQDNHATSNIGGNGQDGNDRAGKRGKPRRRPRR